MFNKSKIFWGAVLIFAVNMLIAAAYLYSGGLATKAGQMDMQDRAGGESAVSREDLGESRQSNSQPKYPERTNEEIVQLLMNERFVFGQAYDKYFFC